MNVMNCIKKCIVFVSILVPVALSGCAPKSSSVTTGTPEGGPADIEMNTGLGLPAFELAVPSEEASREYLGVSGSETFKITDIEAKVVIIEVFNMYCPHCQKEAPKVNELFEALQNDPDLNSEIKLIGIGVGNTPYEVNLFREKYGISFPLFPDQDMSIGKELGVLGTPTFVGIELKSDGTYRAFYSKSGKMGSGTEFLDKMITMSGPDEE